MSFLYENYTDLISLRERCVLTVSSSTRDVNQVRRVVLSLVKRMSPSPHHVRSPGSPDLALDNGQRLLSQDDEHGLLPIGNYKPPGLSTGEWFYRHPSPVQHRLEQQARLHRFTEEAPSLQ